MATTSHWMLRRIAARSLQVLDRHEDAEPAIAAYRGRLGVSAPAFIQVYDFARAGETTRARALAERTSATATLYRKGRGWIALLAQDIPGFRSASFGDKQGVPDDVVAQCENLIVVTDEHERATGQALPYAEALKADLGPAIEAAQAEVGTAGASQATTAGMQQAVREAAETLHRDLVAFRRTLAVHIGRGHPDYQKLRVSRARAPDVDDDEIGAALLDEPVLDHDDPVAEPTSRESAHVAE